MTVPSVLMCVGREHYKLHEFIEEAENHGVSKHVSKTAIPEGLIKGESKIFLAHPDAIVMVTEIGKSLEQLAYKLFELGFLEETDLVEMVDLGEFGFCENLQPEDFVPDGMLEITMILSKLDHAQLKELSKEYGLKFCLGIFGYSYFQGFQYVARPDEDRLPKELQHLDGYVEPVHVIYKEKKNEQDW